MTYFGFLALFLGVPMTVLALVAWRDRRADRRLPASLHAMSPAWAIFGMIAVALLYTTPWDNYLVATGVWWYDLELVTGIVIGWVPIEEYTFFLLQPIFTGMWLLFLARRLDPPGDFVASSRWRWTTSVLLTLLWLASVGLLVSGWLPGTYLALILVWAIPAILLQTAFGADILRHYGKLVLWALIPATLYLAGADAIAIASGTWTIDPAQSTGILFGNLPLEEFLFFLITNVLIVFGLVLVLASESQTRIAPVVRRLSRKRRPDQEAAGGEVVPEHG